MLCKTEKGLGGPKSLKGPWVPGTKRKLNEDSSASLYSKFEKTERKVDMSQKKSREYQGP